jgi:cytochrome c-type biogenesis protein CcmE
MKKTHIIAIIVIAIAIGAIISTSGSSSAYLTFDEAKAMAKNGDNSKIHVVGTLIKDANKKIIGMEYNPEVDANYFSFLLKDTTNVEMRVVYGSPKPADFERSEKIVIVGKVQGDVFMADKILMKCPSKYTEKEIKVESKE